MAAQPKRVALFNCDITYDLKTVEEFLEAEDENYGFNISVDPHTFRLRQMAEMVETTLPTLKMDLDIDFAIFVVPANESRLSINEDNAGIEYGRLYKALRQVTDGKVLIVNSGDSYYKDEDEKDPEPEFIPPASQDAQQEPFLMEDEREELIKNEEETNTRRRSVSSDRGRQKDGLRGDKKEANYGATDSSTSGTPVDYPAGTVLLQTRMRYGKISFHGEDVLTRKDPWQPSERQVTHLREDYRSTPDAQVRFTSSGYGGVSYDVIVPKPDYYTRLKNCLCSCCTLVKNFFVAPFLGLVHCLGLL